MPTLEDLERRFARTDQPIAFSKVGTVKSKTSEESIRTEFCDGFLPDVPSWDAVEDQDGGQKNDGPVQGRSGVCTSDRNELMERIKRGESPTWVPSQTLQKEYSKIQCGGPAFTSPSKSTCHDPRALLSAGFQNTAEIKRPQSALHTGDFTRDLHNATLASPKSPASLRYSDVSAQRTIGASSASPWNIPFQPPHPSNSVSPTPENPICRTSGSIPSRSRAPSLNSLSSSYVAKSPTTPLVQQSNNTDLDFSPIDPSMSPSKHNRRHTLPPRPLPGSQERISSNLLALHASAARQPPFFRSNPTSPYQTHRPRRSLTTTWSLQGSSSPQRSSLLSSRRQSFSSEASPLQNASMVGSYEESILRGWMSTAPSKPLNFTAQIGVMGRDNFKPKCPAHVTIPFPAVFYSWNGGIGRRNTNVDDEPSPYVGHIDLSQLPAPAESKKTRQSRSKSPRAYSGHAFGTHALNTHVETVTENGQVARSVSSSHRKRRRTSPPPSSLQRGYRIPQKGQLQIVIKNPNKTAVKPFLVPYDLQDMPVGTKTFFRQRCYSTDRIISGLTSERVLEPGRSFGMSSPKSKPTLRYLIHVNICSPSSGRFYLYQQIRVVFANRVPDNKEQLQTDIQTPQPRYSAYNSSISLARSVSSSGAGFGGEKAYRRRSSGFGASIDEMDDRHPQALASGTSYPLIYESPLPPIPGIPLQFSSTQTPPQSSRFHMDVTYNIGEDRSGASGEGPPFPIFGGLPASPTPPFPATGIPLGHHQPGKNDRENDRPAEDEIVDLDSFSRPTTPSSFHQTLQSPLSDKTDLPCLSSKRSDLSHSSNGENGTYSKLSRWDVGYGGRPSTPELGAGLLTKKLRGLGVQTETSVARGEGTVDLLKQIPFLTNKSLPIVAG
ncbi:MAG: hypothetical protein Q9213_004989 [Squamulea squamosa]